MRNTNKTKRSPNSIIKNESITKLFLYAVTKRVLILTASDEEAKAFHSDILSYAQARFPELVSHHLFNDTVYVSGYEKIVVLSLEKWISQRRIEWCGHVFITAPHLICVTVNGKVSDIPYISNTPKLLTDALAVNSKDIR